MFSRRLGSGLLLAALLCATLPALGDSSARIVRLSYLDGAVQMDRGAGQGFQRAVLNMPVVQGSRLATGDNGTAEVEFEDGSTLRLTPETTVVFRTLSLRDNGTRVSSIDLDRGLAYLDAATKKNDLAITVGGQDITLAHDAQLRIRRSDSALSLAVFKGEVEVQNSGGSVRVKKNETLNLDLNDPSQYELAKDVDSDPYDAWNQERDNYRRTYASNHDHGYNPLYTYGWSDLNYFGGFNNYGSYGWLWRPWGVGPGWDPFADGAWMYYPGSGYMWVSGYPWGWMPYRYGRWMFVPGYGWAWSPGTIWNNWYAMPVIYGAPAGYVVPAPPPVHTGPHRHPGKDLDTVVVGAGPISDVRNPRYHDWVKRPAGAHAPMRKADITPVPPPVATESRTTGTDRTTITPGDRRTLPPSRTAPPPQSRHEGWKRSSPPPRETTPPPPPPRSEAPPMAPPPEMPQQTGGWSGGGGGRTSGGGGGGGGHHESPRK